MGSLALMMCCFIILSPEVRARGRRSLGVFGLVVLGIGMVVECFHSWGDGVPESGIHFLSRDLLAELPGMSEHLLSSSW